jgi:hypothetical protein
MNAFFKKMKNGRVTHGLKKQISARNHGALMKLVESLDDLNV